MGDQSGGDLPLLTDDGKMKSCQASFNLTLVDVDVHCRSK